MLKLWLAVSTILDFQMAKKKNFLEGHIRNIFTKEQFHHTSHVVSEKIFEI